RGNVVHPRREPHVLRVLDDVGDIRKLDGRTVTVGDDHGGVVGGRAQLVVGVYGVGAARAVEASLRLVDVGRCDRGAHVLEVQAVRGERARIDLDPNGRALAPGERHQAHAGKLRDLLRETRIDEVL